MTACLVTRLTPSGINARSILIFFISFTGFLSDLQSQSSIPNKVVMISLDGTPDYLIDRFLKNGVLPADGAFARIRKTGAYAKTVYPINIASTGPSHISIFTGATPGTTGMVGNSFKSKSQQWDEPAFTAFSRPYHAESIFQAARRQGKKVIALGGVGIDYSDSSRMTDRMLMYPAIAGPSAIFNLIVGKGKYILNGQQYIRLFDERAATAPEVELGAGKKAGLWFYLKDTLVDDANILKPSFRIIIDTDSLLSNGYAASLAETGWKVMRIASSGKVYTVSSCLFNSSFENGRFRIYLSPPAEVYGYPQSFMDRMQQSCGLWPGEPDNRKETSGQVSEETWFEQVGRLAAYSKSLILAGMKEENWDLLFGYFSTLDDVQHRYTLTDKRQLDYGAEQGRRPARYEKIIEKWFRVIDGYLLEIMDAAPKGTSFIIFSDHGMIPTHSVLLLNNLLEQSGYAFSKNEVKAVPSGNSAHIYINPAKIGTERYAAYLAGLKKTLEHFRDEKSGEPFFELVADSNGQKKIGLYHADYSGDLFVSCRKGYSLSGRYIPSIPYWISNSFDPDMFKNQPEGVRNFLINGTMNETGRAVHGCLAKIREGQSIFYAWGGDVPAKKLKGVSSLQIAATVSKLLKMRPPAQALDKPVF
ncbi:MAG: alkaline phosphatase family protein [Sediminibacterium sp.]